MTAKVLYAADDTTTEMLIEGNRLTTQVWGEGRGMVTVFNEENKLVRRATFAKVHFIDVTVLE